MANGKDAKGKCSEIIDSHVCEKIKKHGGHAARFCQNCNLKKGGD